MSKKIVVLVGSPRKEGNSELLAKAFVKGAESAGNQIDVFLLSEHKINPCIACEYCFKNLGQCVQKDGMQGIYAKLYEADAVVFSSPIYYFGLTAQIKSAIDRFFVCASKPFPITSSALLLAFEDTSSEAGEPAIANYKAMLKYLKWQDLGIVTAENVYEKGAIVGHRALLQAEELGKSIR